MKHTAVEWLISELQRRILIIESEPDGIVRTTMIDNFLVDIQQAKEMEKEQIIEAWIVSDNPLQRMEAEKYYNITYKQD